jgi:RNA-directed DNA polymerase
MKIIELLNIELGASIETLNRIIRTAPKRYKIYTIPKKSGGTRTIAHPARELKAIQRVILRGILDQMEVSEIAMAYVEKRGIVANANQHLGQRWILKLDFKDFFHSIGPRDWDRLVRWQQKFSYLSEDREILHRLLFWGAATNDPTCLSIGAPTSPSISNLVCLKLDKWMIEQANERNLRITRYADDITISGSNIHQLTRFERDLEKVLAQNKGIRLELNAKKRGLYGPGERRMVTGLVLTPDGELSIGRERKREISALIHRYKTGAIVPEFIMRAKGLLAFSKSAEPKFFYSMVQKYGEETIYMLLRADVPELIDLDNF